MTYLSKNIMNQNKWEMLLMFLLYETSSGFVVPSAISKTDKFFTKSLIRMGKYDYI